MQLSLYFTSVPQHFVFQFSISGIFCLFFKSFSFPSMDGMDAVGLLFQHYATSLTHGSSSFPSPEHVLCFPPQQLAVLQFSWKTSAMLNSFKTLLSTDTHYYFPAQPGRRRAAPSFINPPLELSLNVARLLTSRTEK